MKFRITALLVALPALIAGLLVASSSPTVAASHDAFLRSSKIAINSKGLGKVAISCHSSHTCKGTLKFTGSTRLPDFSVPGNSTKYVTVAVHASQGPSDPADPAYPDAGAAPHHESATLNVHETYPNNRSYSYPVATEIPVTSQNIKGTINAHHASSAGEMTDLKVELLRELRGGSVESLHTRENLSEGGTYSFSVALGTNNSSSDPYELKISGIDKDHNARSWYWRGSSNATTGGSRYIRKASTVRATSSGPFVADFNYGSISGSIGSSAGTGITVAAVPPPGSDAATDRNLDLVSCADVHGRTTTGSGGHYEVDFLPFEPGDKRYLVGAIDGSHQTWNGNISGGFGSCLDTIGYAAHTKDNLIDLGSGNATANFNIQTGNTVKIDGHFSKKFTATGQGDRWVTVREKVPGLHVLEDPVVKYATVDSEGNATLTNIPKGEYYVEMGRRTGCADWQKSHFPNNSAYFKGLDRGAESWKSFTKLSALSNAKEDIARSVRPNHATSAEQGHVPSGYKGWMYRDFCKAYGAGTINSMSVPAWGDPSFTKKITSDSQGAVVKGHVSRTGGRTNKEMMVRLSSSKQTLVVRADVTDGSGNFYISGVASGTYTVSVNSDSWRGIGRTFTGKHTITVSAGHGYNLGTLTFHG